MPCPFLTIFINNREQVAPQERLVRPDSAEVPPSFWKGKHSAVPQAGDAADNSESGVELGPRHQGAARR